MKNDLQIQQVHELRHWLITENEGRYGLSDELFQLAEQVAIDHWTRRARERDLAEPNDLSGACKFSTLFMKTLFGGVVQGNDVHQFNRIGGKVVDLNGAAADVKKMIGSGADLYRHDPIFFGNKDHLESMSSCLPRVKSWVEDFDRLAAWLTNDGAAIEDTLRLAASFWKDQFPIGDAGFCEPENANWRYAAKFDLACLGDREGWTEWFEEERRMAAGDGREGYYERVS